MAHPSVLRDCRLSAAVEVSAQVTRGLQKKEVRESLYQQMEHSTEREHVVSCEHKFDQALEQHMAELGLTELKKNNIKAQVQACLLKTTPGDRVKFVRCSEGSSGKLHIQKTEHVRWCGRLWSQRVDAVCVETERCRKCLRSLAVGASFGEVLVLDP